MLVFPPYDLDFSASVNWYKVSGLVPVQIENSYFYIDQILFANYGILMCILHVIQVFKYRAGVQISAGPRSRTRNF